MATASDVIKGSLRLLGVIAAGESPTAGESADGLTALNEMLESWSNEGLMIYSKVREEFTLTPNDGAYSIGATGDFATTRPMRIERAAIEDQSASPTLEYPLRLLNLEQWAEIPDKDSTADNATDLYCDDEFPNANLKLYPVPTVANKLVLYSWKVLTTFATTGTTVSLPPGYLRALRFNLAVELAAEYGRPAPAEVVQVAMESKSVIKRMNIKPKTMKCDPAVMGSAGSYNILTGDYR